jgi:hypothetical protein
MMMEIEDILEIIDSMDNMDDDILGDEDNKLQNEKTDLIDHMTDDEMISHPIINLDNIEYMSEKINSDSRKILTLKMTIESIPIHDTIECISEKVNSISRKILTLKMIIESIPVHDTIEYINERINSILRKVFTLKRIVESIPVQDTIELRIDTGITIDYPPIDPNTGIEDININNPIIDQSMISNISSDSILESNDIGDILIPGTSIHFRTSNTEDVIESI